MYRDRTWAVKETERRRNYFDPPQRPAPTGQNGPSYVWISQLAKRIRDYRPGPYVRLCLQCLLFGVMICIFGLTIMLPDTINLGTIRFRSARVVLELQLLDLSRHLLARILTIITTMCLTRLFCFAHEKMAGFMAYMRRKSV